MRTAPGLDSRWIKVRSSATKQKPGPTFPHPWRGFNQSLYSDVAEPVGAQRLCQCQCVLWHLAAPRSASSLRRDPTFIRQGSLCPSAIKATGTTAAEIGAVGAPVCNYLDAECGSGRPTELRLIATRNSLLQLLHLTEGVLWIPDTKTCVSLHLKTGPPEMVIGRLLTRQRLPACSFPPGWSCVTAVINGLFLHRWSLK